MVRGGPHALSDVPPGGHRCQRVYLGAHTPDQRQRECETAGFEPRHISLRLQWRGVKLMSFPCGVGKPGGLSTNVSAMGLTHRITGSRRRDGGLRALAPRPQASVGRPKAVALFGSTERAEVTPKCPRQGSHTASAAAGVQGGGPCTTAWHLALGLQR
jgi:hypothetical protein